MSSTEWSAYLHDQLDVDLGPISISDAVVARLQALYQDHLPLLPDARETVISLGSVGRWASHPRPTVG